MNTKETHAEEVLRAALRMNKQNGYANTTRNPKIEPFYNKKGVMCGFAIKYV